VVVANTVMFTTNSFDTGNPPRFFYIPDTHVFPETPYVVSEKKWGAVLPFVAGDYTSGGIGEAEYGGNKLQYYLPMQRGNNNTATLTFVLTGRLIGTVSNSCIGLNAPPPPPSGNVTSNIYVNGINSGKVNFQMTVSSTSQLYSYSMGSVTHYFTVRTSTWEITSFTNTVTIPIPSQATKVTLEIENIIAPGDFTSPSVAGMGIRVDPILNMSGVLSSIKAIP